MTESNLYMKWVKIALPSTTIPPVFLSSFAQGDWELEYHMGRKTWGAVEGSPIFALRFPSEEYPTIEAILEQRRTEGSTNRVLLGTGEEVENPPKFFTIAQSAWLEQWRDGRHSDYATWIRIPREDWVFLEWFKPEKII